MRGATTLPRSFMAGMCHFNPRSPCGERPYKTQDVRDWNLFQSTLPMRGATLFPLLYPWEVFYFNPRSPCGERLYKYIREARLFRFQSTLPMRGATYRCPKRHGEEVFQSTLPMRGATYLFYLIVVKLHISIHAPHAGSDILKSSHGNTEIFQSTLPMRGATYVRVAINVDTGISIHAPHAGSDLHLHAPWCIIKNFNPRSPCGERLPGEIHQ